MKAFISIRAERSVERIAARWGEHADNPGVFMRELMEMIQLLETTRSPGARVPTSRHPAAKRILLRKSRCHVYFEVDEAQERLEIMEVWDARRRRAPRL
ncbi:MAG TPA: hypothetical protein VH165_14280 [Kofleriaceae bacterium]|nr:hypothetical protein [Kofleriaceae bacterium]